MTRPRSKHGYLLTPGKDVYNTKDAFALWLFAANYRKLNSHQKPRGCFREFLNPIALMELLPAFLSSKEPTKEPTETRTHPCTCVAVVVVFDFFVVTCFCGG